MYKKTGRNFFRPVHLFQKQIYFFAFFALALRSHDEQQPLHFLVHDLHLTGHLPLQDLHFTSHFLPHGLHEVLHFFGHDAHVTSQLLQSDLALASTIGTANAAVNKTKSNLPFIPILL